jgi:hypothetical protein
MKCGKQLPGNDRRWYCQQLRLQLQLLDHARFRDFSMMDSIRAVGGERKRSPNSSMLRTPYHIERTFAKLTVEILWFDYHQIRFISFGIWFLGLFLTDFTSLVTNGSAGQTDVLAYIQVISSIHLAFLLIFLLYLIYRHTISRPDEGPSIILMVQSMFDLSLHLDVAAIIFSVTSSFWVIETLIVADIGLTLFLTPFKRWRAAVSFCGALPTVILAHVDVDPAYVFLPLSIVLFCPFVFTIASTAFSQTLPRWSRRLISRLDPSLLPNLMASTISTTISTIHPSDVARRPDQPPSINDPATTGDEFDYVDFKSVPMAIAGTFFIHFGLFAQERHHQPLVVMAHYFLTLAAILINTRVVAFPAIILTNVIDETVVFNSVWPELSFV